MRTVTTVYLSFVAFGFMLSLSVDLFSTVIGKYESNIYYTLVTIQYIYKIFSVIVSVAASVKCFRYLSTFISTNENENRSYNARKTVANCYVLHLGYCLLQMCSSKSKWNKRKKTVLIAEQRKCGGCSSPDGNCFCSNMLL
ncbi:hypothetical protein T4D_10602 [Trichinella pseudospiralis]|uniref:Uncharacterized protein n=1 Tax=Trichinella pseudospiralis TaxID=6337 RepID=A0A0V1G6B1_TRIPS|nr:hypothetical protein T4D_10602 [Trichinella pseudospiralis]